MRPRARPAREDHHLDGSALADSAGASNDLATGLSSHPLEVVPGNGAIPGREHSGSAPGELVHSLRVPPAHCREVIGDPETGPSRLTLHHHPPRRYVAPAPGDHVVAVDQHVVVTGRQDRAPNAVSEHERALDRIHGEDATVLVGEEELVPRHGGPHLGRAPPLADADHHRGIGTRSRPALVSRELGGLEDRVIPKVDHLVRHSEPAVPLAADRVQVVRVHGIHHQVGQGRQRRAGRPSSPVDEAATKPLVAPQAARAPGRSGPPPNA